MKFILFLTFALVTILNAKNIAIVVDAQSNISTNKIKEALNKLNQNDSLDLYIVYNDLDRTKKYAQNLRVNTKEFNEEIEKFIFRVNNLDMNITNQQIKKIISSEKTIKVKEKRKITFNKSDTLFVIDDSGSMSKFVNDVAKDIRNVANQINFNNSTFGIVICPDKDLRSESFISDKNKINNYLSYQGLKKSEFNGEEIPCALKNSVHMFKRYSKNQNKIMFYFGDGDSEEDNSNLKILKEMGVVIIPIAVGDMNKRTLSNLSTDGNIIKSTNVNFNTLKTITKTVVVDKVIFENKEVTVPATENKLFNNLSNIKINNYNQVFLISDMSHNNDNFNYREVVQKVGKEKAKAAVLKKYRIDLNKITY